ncbi:MAG: hypothetical protein ACTSQQ_02565 [Candidatus Helarchaeota archaeon]
MTYDNFFKQLLRDFLTHCEIHPDSPVGKLPLKIDLIIKCPQKSIKTAVIPLLETHFAYLNLVEYNITYKMLPPNSLYGTSQPNVQLFIIYF